MVNTFHCPNCGAALEIKDNGVTAVPCPFCGSSVIVPEEMRPRKSAEVVVVVQPPVVDAGQVHLPSSGIQFISSEQSRKALKVAGGATLATGCVSVVLPVVILLGVGIFVLFMMTLSGGPLEEWWMKTNPWGRQPVTLTFGSKGIGPGLFSDARTIAVDHNNGSVYVGEYEGGRVQVFSPDGKFITQWNAGSPKDSLSSLAVDRKGVVFAVAGVKLLRYDGNSGQELGEVQTGEESPWVDDVTVTAGNQILIVTHGETLRLLDNDLKPILTIPAAISTISGDAELDAKVAVDGQGYIYALGTFNNAVFKFSPQGQFVSRFGSDGDQAGQFRAPMAIAVDGQGRVYVSDSKGIQVFEGDGRYVELINVPGAAFGMTFNDQGDLFVVSNKQQVYKYEFRK